MQGLLLLVVEVELLDSTRQLIQFILEGLPRVADLGDGNAELFVGQQISVSFEPVQDWLECSAKGLPGGVKRGFPSYNLSG